MYNISIKSFFISFFILTLYSFAQPEPVVFNLPELKIYDNMKKKDRYIHFAEKNNSFLLKESLLVADTNKFSYSVNIENIHKISFRNGSNFWGGAAIGAAIGGVIGFFFGGYFTVDGPVKFKLGTALVGIAALSIPFGAAGGLIGLLSPRFEEYILTGNDAKIKHSKLLRIFKKNKK